MCTRAERALSYVLLTHLCRDPPHPPSLHSFPTTTLFRSATDPRDRVGGARGVCELDVDQRRFPSGRSTGGPLVDRPEGNRDRKSTRLNSSHVAISYAVFCVKNKTEEHAHSRDRGAGASVA